MHFRQSGNVSLTRLCKPASTCDEGLVTPARPNAVVYLGQVTPSARRLSLPHTLSRRRSKEARARNAGPFCQGLPACLIRERQWNLESRLVLFYFFFPELLPPPPQQQRAARIPRIWGARRKTASPAAEEPPSCHWMPLALVKRSKMSFRWHPQINFPFECGSLDNGRERNGPLSPVWNVDKADLQAPVFPCADPTPFEAFDEPTSLPC